MAVLAALAAPGSVSRLSGIAHLRGHETDRLAALSTEINRLGGDCRETADGLEITATPLRPGTWQSYADHRMATAGAIVGLRVAGVEVDDIETTAKTLPNFPRMWADMLRAGVQRLRPGDYDESDVKIRSGKGSRPRTKTRPEHADAKSGHGGQRRPRPVGMCARRRRRSTGHRDAGARTGPHTDRRRRHVDVVGDLSGRPDTLARIVRRGPRRTVLRRTADDTDPTERVVVANADQLLIVVALADPPPRTGLVDRTLIAAYTGGLIPILCLTKTDLAPAAPFAEQYADLDLEVIIAGRDDPLDAVAHLLAGKITVLLGHSGVGKSTLVNRLVPEAHRAVGEVTDIGRGRHTSTQSVALPFDHDGWVIDTPGIRSFGLAHIKPDDVVVAFSDLAEAIKDCPRGCGHMGPPADPECALDTLTGPGRPSRRRRAPTAGRDARGLPEPQPSACDRTHSRLACMFFCHSASRLETILASLSGIATIAGVSPDGPGPIRPHCRTRTPSLVGSTSNAHVALVPSGPTTLYTQRRWSSTSTTSHTVDHSPNASCLLRPWKRAPTSTAVAPSSQSTPCSSVEQCTGRLMSVTSAQAVGTSHRTR